MMPLAGTAEWYPLCVCISVDAAVEILRHLLAKDCNGPTVFKLEKTSV
jgi:hypothetical protein